MPDDHYDRTAEADDSYGRQPQEAQTPSSEITTFHEFDGCVQTLPHPLSPPMPFTAFIPAPGLEAAKPSLHPSQG